MRLHVLSVPHTVVNREYLNCAFTQNVGRFCRMMKSLGHRVYFYGHERSEVECDEHIAVMDDAALADYGSLDDHQRALSRPGDDAALHRRFNERCIAAIGERREPRDFILCFWGVAQKPVADAFPDCLAVEPGIGYPATAVFAPYRVFVSYAHMHHVYGLMGVQWASWYDCVIPNSFDVGEFEYREVKEDYLLYLGRIVKDKGIEIAVRVAETLGTRLVLAGPGDLEAAGQGARGDRVVHVGFADLERRKRLLRDARCLLMPTYYLEPFGCVVVEALLSGTPVITTDWGAFPEINLHGITGYRCRTFEQFVWAARNVYRIRPAACRAWAAENFSMERVKHMYQEYLEMLAARAREQGFYAGGPERAALDWLTRAYPADADAD